MNELINLRHHLHQYPELSGKETHTAQHISAYLRQQKATTIIEQVGGTGIMAIYEYGREGSTLLFRCELDALPISEENDMPYKSTNDGVSHKCGHDGHMTIIAGVARWLKNQTFKTGKVILLFQPSEENGLGAKEMLKDPSLLDLEVDFAFALHNIPGRPLHEVILLEESFSPSVQSFSIELIGKESHASEPEKGINPAVAMGQLIESLDILNRTDEHDPSFSLLTPIHIDMGQKAYGISAGKGELHYTIRTWNESNMTSLVERIEKLSKDICDKHHLSYELNWFEYFPAAKNHPLGNEMIQKAAIRKKLSVKKQKLPFRFGEDFGWFSKKYKTSMFGLGSGIDTPPLHNPTYDFPDELIETGINIFTSIIRDHLD